MSRPQSFDPKQHRPLFIMLNGFEIGLITNQLMAFSLLLEESANIKTLPKDQQDELLKFTNAALNVLEHKGRQSIQ